MQYHNAGATGMLPVLQVIGAESPYKPFRAFYFFIASKTLWEQFQALIGRKKPQKDHER